MRRKSAEVYKHTGLLMILRISVTSLTDVHLSGLTPMAPTYLPASGQIDESFQERRYI